MLLEEEVAKQENRGKILKIDRVEDIEYIYVIFENMDIKKNVI